MDFTHAQAAHKPTAMALHLVDHLFKRDVLFKSTVHGTKEYAPPDQDIIMQLEVSKGFAKLVQVELRTMHLNQL